jgi:hypothetical protein
MKLDSCLRLIRIEASATVIANKSEGRIITITKDTVRILYVGRQSAARYTVTCDIYGGTLLVTYLWQPG